MSSFDDDEKIQAQERQLVSTWAFFEQVPPPKDGTWIFTGGSLMWPVPVQFKDEEWRTANGQKAWPLTNKFRARRWALATEILGLRGSN